MEELIVCGLVVQVFVVLLFVVACLTLSFKAVHSLEGVSQEHRIVTVESVHRTVVRNSPRNAAEQPSQSIHYEVRATNGQVYHTTDIVQSQYSSRQWELFDYAQPGDQLELIAHPMSDQLIKVGRPGGVSDVVPF